MKGYVKNISRVWTHAMKRSIGPGMEVSLTDLYNQYGAKHSLDEGEEFVNWLRTVKLRDTNKWKVFYEDGVNVVEEKKEVVKPKENRGNVAPMVPNKMEIKDIVLLSVREARAAVPKIQNLSLLKYALKEANQLAGKDTLCIILRKRIKDLQLGR